MGGEIHFFERGLRLSTREGSKKGAHELKTNNFAVSPIRDHCLNIKLVKQFAGDLNELEEASAANTGMRSGSLYFTGAAKALLDPRAGFFLAINCYTSAGRMRPAPHSPVAPMF